jgi:methylated-DNA-[protein]-cysteine S-methyltransferase
LLVATDAEGRLVCVSLGANEATLEDHATRHDAELRAGGRVRSRAHVQLREYLDGRRRAFDLVLRPLGTEFERLAWASLCRIPFGATRSYGEQAAAMGRPSASRAVGRANGKNPIPIVIPCHRVIGSNGSLVGFGGGLDLKRWLLAHEGVGAQATLSFA